MNLLLLQNLASCLELDDSSAASEVIQMCLCQDQMPQEWSMADYTKMFGEIIQKLGCWFDKRFPSLEHSQLNLEDGESLYLEIVSR